MSATKLKKLLVLVLMCGGPICLNAQDTMVTKSGDIKTVYNVEISSSAVFYKSSSAADAQIERIAKEDLFMIKRPDGTMYDLGDVSSAPVTQVTAQTTVSTPENNAISEEALKLNQKLIAKYNSVTPTITGKEGKDVSRVYCTLGVSEDSYLTNDDLELSITTDINEWSCGIPIIYLNIKNKTSKTIYFDLGNTFFISGDAATPYYIPTASSTSATSGSGVSVNAGAVTGALGIGGAAGKLASGINVGGGSSSTSVNVVYSQRVIAIPPLSSKKLDGQNLFSEDGQYNGIAFSWSSNGKNRIMVAHVDHEYTAGESYVMNPENSPANFSFHVTYSYTEDCMVTKSMRVDLYTRHILGYRYNSGNGMTLLETNGTIGFPAKTLIDKSKGKSLMKALLR